jgi:hypothetical protein
MGKGSGIGRKRTIIFEFPVFRDLQMSDFGSSQIFTSVILGILGVRLVTILVENSLSEGRKEKDRL